MRCTVVVRASVQPSCSGVVPFGVQTLHVDGSAVIAITGEVDVATADRLWDVIEQTLTSGTPLVLDMHGVTFFDVSGLRVLFRALQRLDQQPFSLVLRSPTPIVRLLLDATGASKLMTIQGKNQEGWRIERRTRVAERPVHLVGQRSGETQ
jgi:anti-anti-sigma factor